MLHIKSLNTYKSIKSALRRSLAVILAVSIALPAGLTTAFAATAEAKLNSNYEILDGLTYTNLVANGAAGRNESFYLTLEQDSDVFPITVQSSGTIYGSATVTKAIQVGEEMGYNVIGAINTDYFSTSTGVPMGMVVEDGEYQSSPNDFPVITITDGEVEIADAPEITLTVYNETTGDSYEIPHLNKYRVDTGGMYLLNENFSTTSTRTTTDGWMVLMEVDDEEDILTVDGEITLTVTDLFTTDIEVAIGEGVYVLTAATGYGLSYVYDTFSVGDQITIQTSCDSDTVTDAQWVSGAGDLMIDDGEMTDSSNWEHTTEGRAPRTALGILADGSTIYYVSDGRQTGYAAGLTQVELAEELLALGCVYAVNLDGGGSSSLSANLPGDSGATVQNLPSDGSNRSCATYILLVTEKEGDGDPDKLAWVDDGAVVLTGTSLSIEDIVAVDEYGTTLSTTVDELQFESYKYGSFDDNLYTAGAKAGTDTITFYDSDLKLYGTAQIHVVDSLTDFSITRLGSSAALSSLYLTAGETVQLDASGEYWLREALYGYQNISWSLGDVATVSDTGLLTPLREGTITASVGGLTQSITITLSHTHDDVTSDHWSYDAVSYCYANGIMNGISTTEFGLGQNIKRGDFVLTLYKALGQPTVSTYTAFSDVQNSDYYATAISWAAENGITTGMGDGSFGAQTSITREQAFTMLGRALDLLGLDLEEGSTAVLQYFTDYESISEYAQQPTATLVTHQLVSGSDSKINPSGTLTREEMATLMERFLTYDADSVTPLVPPEVAPTGLSLSQTDFVLLYGETVQLEPIFSPTGSSATVTWSTSDSSIATVSSGGVVTNVYLGIGQPSVTITATYGNLVASATVRCRPVSGDDEDFDDDINFPETNTDTNTDSSTDSNSSTDTTVPTGIGTGTVIDAESGLNLRGGPSSSYAINTKLSNGTSVIILDNSLDGWYQVYAIDQNGSPATGYVSADYIQLTGDLADTSTSDTSTPDTSTPDTSTPDSSTVYLTATVTDADTLNVRSEASTSGTVLGKLTLGTTVTILSAQEGWYQITATANDSSTVTGYVSSDYITLPPKYTVTDATILNVRSGAGSSYDILDKISEGDAVYVLSTTDGWCEILYQSGTNLAKGYVSADYLTPAS